jgi:hypothetical protein
VLLWSFPAGASSPEVERLANEAARHADLTKIIIVGEEHDNVRLADELLELLTLLRANDKFDCLFVEFPTDLQDEFDQAVNEVDIDRLVEAFYDSRRPYYLTAFRKLGHADQANIVSMLHGRVKKISKNFPVNTALLTYLRENKISLLPYDASSPSTVMADIAVFNIREYWRFVSDAIPAPDSKMQTAIIQNGNARNSIMAQNIFAKFASHQCNKAVVVVGTAHIADKEELERFYGIRIETYTPLQSRLEQTGLISAVVGELLSQ